MIFSSPDTTWILRICFHQDKIQRIKYCLEIIDLATHVEHGSVWLTVLLKSNKYYKLIGKHELQNKLFLLRQIANNLEIIVLFVMEMYVNTASLWVNNLFLHRTISIYVILRVAKNKLWNCAVAYATFMIKWWISSSVHLSSSSCLSI